MSFLTKNDLSNTIDSFFDPDFTGFFSAIDYDYDEILTKEKSLEDQAIVLISGIKSNNKKIANLALKYILDSFDNENVGVIEFREQYGLVNELGNTKTTYRSFLIVYSLFLAAAFFEDEALFNKASILIENIESKCFNTENNTYINKFSRDYETIINSDETTISLALSILAYIELLNKHSDDTIKNRLKRNLRLLENKVLDDGAVPDITDIYSKSLPISKIDGEVSAITAIAFIKTANFFKDEFYIETAKKIVNFINDHLWDYIYSGYFTHCNLDGNVQIHKEFVTLLTSAIPIKTSRVNTLILLANKLLVANDSTATTEYINKTELYLATLYDSEKGGFFIGEGYFWTPPATPVGPFHRLMLPSRETAGTFHFGSSSFLRLYNKYVSSQATALLALNYPDTETQELISLQNKISLSKYLPQKNNEIIDNDTELCKQKKVSISDENFISKHIRWIMDGYTKKIGFGWTPNSAPIGTKPDRTPAVFGTHHSISNLKVLGVEIEDQKEVADWIRCCQSSNGAYGEYPGGPADVLNTYLAIDLLDILGESNFGDKEACVRFLKACQNPDGGFGVVPGFKSDLFHSNLAAVALKTMNENPDNLEGLINYYMSARNEDGGYGEYVGAASDTYSCYRTISTLSLYGLEVPKKEETIAFIKGCQDKSGGFSNDKIGKASMIATYHAVASLFLLKSEPDMKELCYQWLLDCQTPDGGFSNIPKVTTGTIDEGFAAIQSLALLKSGLTKKWAVYVS